MEGPDGIEASWRFVSHALRFGAGVAVHLSKLRPKGEENDKGLVASGPVSFAKIYSTLNEVLRRGGVYKNGAVVCHLDLSHPDVLEFITATRADLPWVKRCVNINPHWWGEAKTQVKLALLEGIRRGDIWLNKTKVDVNGVRIYGNVCLEVYLPSRGTCLLQHINLGACEYEDLVPAFMDGMLQLCNLHGQTGVNASGEYLAPVDDRQVGLGMLGLANLLRRYGITYDSFGHALDIINSDDITDEQQGLPAVALALELYTAVNAAADIARIYGHMDRAFAIAPTASCSYRYQDLDGFTTCPEIAPPISQQVDRDSGTFGVESFDYGPVETASEVGWEAYKRVADGIVRMLDKTGLAHGYSFNSWSDVITYDEAFIEDWLASPQTSLYYSLQVMGDSQDKTSAYAALDEAEVTDYLESILNEPPSCNCGE
tara:strand:- start:50 stop:1336 length:1287 start_codon:yes stop_codon:yes gene_type:complete